MSEEWAGTAGREEGHTVSVAPEIKKTAFIYFSFPNRQLFVREHKRGHDRPAIDPRLV